MERGDNEEAGNELSNKDSKLEFANSLPRKWKHVSGSTPEPKDLNRSSLLSTLECSNLETMQDAKIISEEGETETRDVVISNQDLEEEERTEATNSTFKLKICECIKTTKDKGKEGTALEDEVLFERRVSTEEGCSTSSEESINLAPTAYDNQEASSTRNQVFSVKPTKYVKEVCCSTAMNLFDELHAVRISFNNLTEENVRLKATNVMLSEINAMLETQVSEFKETLVECMNAKHELEAVLKREVVLKELLRKEQEVIARWNNSSYIVSNIIKSQGMDTFCKETWKCNNKKL
ncbi:hypothetical protein POM88_016805 [Heracleum sosnowskyi]|uniref:Uncharacterized protein n=1 Tax=Heracleum sosnowskyi TaxID=360622 RepID=A0AAD8IMP4_9APIA|nr:hypothetical protein POM88_016805 [Heracleum sosnowskyi]